MIVADTSALLAVLFGEEDAPVFIDAFAKERILLGAASHLEAHVATARRLGSFGPQELTNLVTNVVDTVVAFDGAHLDAATRAWDRFGKGRHPAQLNFGDCMAYATAKIAGAPLLFKGDDFAQTDIASAV